MNRKCIRKRFLATSTSENICELSIADVVGVVVTNKHSAGSIVLRFQPRKILVGKMSSQFLSLRNRNNKVTDQNHLSSKQGYEVRDDQDLSMTRITYYRTSN